MAHNTILYNASPLTPASNISTEGTVTPHIDNHGVSVHCHVEGEGSPFVLQHGFAMSLERWHEAGYVDALRRDHQVILIDARGHGASDKPHDIEAYSPRSSVADVLAVLDALDVSKAHFWGYSMGGAESARSAAKEYAASLPQGPF